jgi:acyl-coenzyme A thioesterase PaaI-like protein
MDFARLTAITREDTDRFSHVVDRSSFIARGPNGGYIAAVLLRALSARVADLDGGDARAPRSLTVHYPAPPTEGPAEVVTEVIRAGRSLATCAARLVQHGTTMATSLAAFSRAWPGESWSDLHMPEVAAPDEVTDRGLDRLEPPLFLRYWDYRFTVDREAGPSDPALTEGWIRLADPEPVDAPLVAAMTDAFPPAMFSKATARNPVPTIDLTVHFRAGLPQPDLDATAFVLGRFRTRSVTEGFLEEDGELWTANGVLLAQSRQLAIMLPG